MSPTVTIGEQNMADGIDLPNNVAAAILKEGSESHQALMTDIRHNGATVHNLVRMSALRKFDQLGIGESRAESGLLATPPAPPTTQ